MKKHKNNQIIKNYSLILRSLWKKVFLTWKYF